MSFSARTRAFGFYLATFILSAWLCPSAAGAADIPPAVPSNPTPADGSIAAANPLFKWESDDPDDIPNYYVYLDWGGPDVWLAFVFNPQFQLPWSLPPGTYTWHIEALANPMVIGPTWKFTVPGPAAANSPPNAPSDPHPLNGGSGYKPTVQRLSCEATDPDQQPLAYDYYFGTTFPLPRVGENLSDNPIAYFDVTNLAYATTYSWYVTVRDPYGAVTTGPTWTFRTEEQNPPPYAPYHPVPAASAPGVPVNPSLEWYAYEPDYQPMNFDVYFGADADPPLVSDHQAPSSYDPGLLDPSTPYYWRVVARDSYGAETTSPVWSFTTANTTNRVPSTPSTAHPSWSYHPAQSTVDLSWESTDPDGEQLTFNVYMGTQYPYPKNPLVLVGTTTDHHLLVNTTNNTRYYWTVEVKDLYWTVRPENPWYFDNGAVPVLFSRFDARARGTSVEVHWSLQSDEAMDRYTLFRHEGTTGPAISISNGPVEGVEGAYVDTSVMPGKTYHYELLIRTTDHDEFRSQTVTVSMPELKLALHQNVPNPFNPLTTIRYDLPANARVRLSIIDVAGRRVRTLVDEQQTAGSRSAIWNGRDDAGRAVASGVYFYVLEAGKERRSRKLVLLK